MSRNELVLENLGLVRKIARRYRRPSREWADLVQIGVLGLIRAVDTYDPNRGKLSTWAGYGIRSAIRAAFFIRHQRPQLVGHVALKNPDDDPAPKWDVALLFVRAGLTEREHQALVLRFGLDGGSPAPAHYIARRLRVSVRHASRLAHSALDKLREAAPGCLTRAARATGPESVLPLVDEPQRLLVTDPRGLDPFRIERRRSPEHRLGHQ